MNDTEFKESSRFPKKATAWTVFVVILLVGMFSQLDSLNESIGLDPALPSLIAALLSVVTILVWAFWAFFWAKLRLVGLLIVLVPVVFFTFYYPNFTGDMQFAGFKPRFWAPKVDYVEVKELSADENRFAATEYDFPQFLGPTRTASITNVSLADSWADAPKEIWRSSVGEGWSGFAIVNGFAVTQEQRGEMECVTCYDIASGDLVWNYSVERRHEDLMAMGKVGPRATPTIDEGLVYATSGTGVLDCLNGADGTLVWSKDIPELVGIGQNKQKNSLGIEYTYEQSALAWGRSGSPLIVGDVVVVPAGGPLPSEEDGTSAKPVTLIAFDKKTGDERWRGGNRMVAYGSPSVATIGGVEQILLVSERHAVGHDANTGAELWSHERSGSSNGDANCSQVTVVDDSRLILSKGYGMGGELIEVKPGDGNQWTVNSLSKDSRILKTKFSNPVIYDGHAYSLSDGYLECVKIENEKLKRKWKKRGRFGNGQILLVGDKLLVHAERGTGSDGRSKLFLVRANPDEFEELGAIKTVQGICWNTFAIYKDQVLVRSDLEAACYQLPLNNSTETVADTDPTQVGQPTESPE